MSEFLSSTEITDLLPPDLEKKEYNSDYANA
jgi:hypothetical protein